MKLIKSEQTRGFSLIETMLCIAIMAVITNYAISYFSSSLMKSHRIEATIALNELANKLEQFYNREHQYKGVSLAKLHIKPITKHGYYKLSIIHVDESSYQVGAQPIGSQKQDTVCKIFILNSEGKESVTGTSLNPEQDCW